MPEKIGRGYHKNSVQIFEKRTQIQKLKVSGPGQSLKIELIALKALTHFKL